MRNCVKKFPPTKSGTGYPFEGGVVGKIDYLIYIVFISPPDCYREGWLIH